MGKALAEGEAARVAEAKRVETYDEAVERKLGKLQARASSDRPLAVTGAAANTQLYVYAWVPDDKTGAAQAMRARLQGAGYDRELGDVQIGGLPGGEVWRLERPVWDALQQQRHQKDLEQMKRLGIKPNSMSVQAIPDGDGGTSWFLG